MTTRGPSLRTQQWIAGIGIALTGFAWPIFGAEVAFAYFKPEWINDPGPDAALIRGILGLFVWLGPLFAFAFLYGGLFYQRWLRTNQSALARRQLIEISKAQRSLRHAVEFLEAFAETIKSQSDETSRLQSELASLKSLSNESVSDLKAKLAAIEIANRTRIWLERFFAFAIGVASSIAATYLWTYFGRM